MADLKARWVRLIYSFLACFVIPLVSSEVKIVATDCLRNVNIYGPGWDDPALIVPSRYFFVDHPANCTNRVKSAVIESLSNVRCLARMQVFDASQFSNDLTIFRYRLVNDACLDGLEIILKDENNEIVARRSVEEPIYDDQCYCPERSWPEKAKCDPSSVMYDRLRKDLR